jgi:hypothetical protein
MDTSGACEPVFHMGTYPKKLKCNKKSKVKILKSNLPNRFKFTFNPYTGPRHRLPSKFVKSFTPSLQAKFDRLSICNSSNFNEHFRNEVRKTQPIVFVVHPWLPPLSIRSKIQSLKDKEDNEWQKIYRIYKKIFKFQKLFTALVRTRLRNICMRNCKNTFDAATMDVPKNPVYILNFSQRCSHVYEASTILKSINNRLLLADYMFADPKEPVNLFTNDTFTMGQYISLYEQCKKYSQFSWILNRFRSVNFNLSQFALKFQQQLKLAAIDYYFKYQVAPAENTVIDYFLLNADFAVLPIHISNRFQDTFNYKNPNLYTKSWISLTNRYYKAFELKDTNGLVKIAKECDTLIRKSYFYFIN